MKSHCKGPWITIVVYFISTRVNSNRLKNSFTRSSPVQKISFTLPIPRAYLLMCYYEVGDSIGMESLVHSFRMFLSRSDRVSDSHRESYLEFMRVFRRVLATPPKDNARLQVLKSDIDSLKFSAGKSWLLKKVTQLGA